MKRLTLILLACILFSCKSNPSQQKTINKTVASKHGSVAVAADTVLFGDSILVDQLNHFYFSVYVIANGNSDMGEYKIRGMWGINKGETLLKMPEGLEHAQPVLRRISDDKSQPKLHQFMLGFKTKDDTSFHEYYLITGDHGEIKMKYVKAYVFQ